MNHDYASMLEYANRLPPYVCRMIARRAGRGQQPLSTDEIAERSGLDRKTVLRIAKCKTWAKLFRVVDAFRSACGVTPATERKRVEYVKQQRTNKNPFPHLKRLSWQEQKMINRVLKKIGDYDFVYYFCVICRKYHRKSGGNKYAEHFAANAKHYRWREENK